MINQRWFNDNILIALSDRWGAGWTMLSTEQQITEVYAACWRSLAANERLDNAFDHPNHIDNDDAIPVGRRFAELMVLAETHIAKHIRRDPTFPVRRNP